MQRFINYDEGVARWCRYFSLIEHVRLPDSEGAVSTGTCSGRRMCVAALPVPSEIAYGRPARVVS
jgi:hypothetical protein